MSSAQPLNSGSTHFVDWAREAAIPLTIPGSSKDVDRLSAISHVIGDKSIVAFGENAHYLHEWNEFRTRLFQYLVKHHGFSVFVLESGFVEGRIVHDYVSGGEISWEDVANSITNAWGVWSELKELIQWMRQENKHRASADKLKFYCMDGSGNWSHGKISCCELSKYLDLVSREMVEEFQEHLALPLQNICFENRGNYDKATWDDLLAQTSRLVNLFERHRIEFSTATGQEEYLWALQYAKIQHYLVLCWSQTELNFKEGFKTFWNIRDAAMAKQFEWILDQIGSDEKVLIGAHNNHLQQSPVRVDQATSMGSYLSASLGRDRSLFICATSEQSLKGDVPLSDSNQARYGQVETDCYLLDLRGAPANGPARNWLDTARPDRSNLRFQPVAPGKAWDCVFFHRTVSLAHLALPENLKIPFAGKSQHDLHSLQGHYEVEGFLAASNRFRIRTDRTRLYADARSDTSGELFPPIEVGLCELENGEFVWPNWPARLAFLNGGKVRIIMPGMGTYFGCKMKG